MTRLKILKIPVFWLDASHLTRIRRQDTFHPNLDKGLNIRVNRITRDRKEDEINDVTQPKKFLDFTGLLQTTRFIYGF